MDTEPSGDEFTFAGHEIISSVPAVGGMGAADALLIRYPIPNNATVPAIIVVVFTILVFSFYAFTNVAVAVSAPVLEKVVFPAGNI